jgi:hypothetical protein
MSVLIDLRYGTGSDETVSGVTLKCSPIHGRKRCGADGTDGNANDDTNDGTNDRSDHLAA